MSEDQSPEVRLALLEHRVASLESDRKWFVTAAVGAAAWVVTQVMPFLAKFMAGAGK